MAHVGEELVLGPAGCLGGVTGMNQLVFRGLAPFVFSNKFQIEGFAFLAGSPEICHQGLIGKPRLQRRDQGFLHVGPGINQYQNVKKDDDPHNQVHGAALLKEPIRQGKERQADVAVIELSQGRQDGDGPGGDTGPNENNAQLLQHRSGRKKEEYRQPPKNSGEKNQADIGLHTG